MSPCMSQGGQCIHACHMAVNVSKQIFMTQTFKTCVFGEANFQLANFHNINFQSGVEWSGELPICKFQSTNFQLADFQHMTVNVSKHVTWQSMSSCIPHGVKFQDGWKYTSQIPPTATDLCEKDKTSGSIQAKVHKMRMTSVKKDKTSGSAQAFLQFTHTSYSLPITLTVYP